MYRPVGSTGQLENLHSDHSEGTLIGIVSKYTYNSL